MRRGALIRSIGAAAAAALALLTAPAVGQASVGNFAMAIQQDGKIVVAGGAGYVGGPKGDSEYGAVVRYLPNGRLDPSFGQGDGILLAKTLRPFTAVDLQEDGRIVLTAPVGQVARVLPSGRFDADFGRRGKASGIFSASYPTSVRVGAGGAIYVGGMTGYLDEPAEHWYGRLYRISPDGFRGDWVASMTSGDGRPGEPKTFLNDFLFGPGGEVIGAGTSAERRPDARSHAALARLLPGAVDRGSPAGPDPSFGGGVGLVESSFFPDAPHLEAANALSRQGKKLLIAGEGNNDLLLTRYTRNGLLDRRFGRGGAVTTDFRAFTVDRANAVAVAADGEIFAAGSSGHGCFRQCVSMLLARYGKNGRLVRKFGAEGIVSPNVDADAYGKGAAEIAYDLSLREQGKILVGGIVKGPNSSRFFLRRFLADGRPDPSFGRRGRLSTLPVAADRRR
jgi:uncharacterized delta-60 repeat protein